MRKRPVGTHRRRWGIGALAVASIAMASGVSTSAQNPERAPDSTDTQAGTVDEQPTFAGDWVDQGVGASSAAPAEDGVKTEGFGHVGSNKNHKPDVVGGSVASEAEPDAPPPVPNASRWRYRMRISTPLLPTARRLASIVMTKTQIGIEGQMSAAQVDAQHAKIDTALGASEDLAAGHRLEEGVRARHHPGGDVRGDQGWHGCPPGQSRTSPRSTLDG